MLKFLKDGIVDHLLNLLLSPDLRPSAGVERIGPINIEAVSRIRNLEESFESDDVRREGWSISR